MLTARPRASLRSRGKSNGCSTGGRQGLALAQTHGDEFDGFVIGAPAIYWQQFRLADDWPALVIKDKLTAKGKSISTGQINAVNASAIAACDVQGYDTVADGLIDDPRACTFSAKKNICGAPAAPNCLDADQAAAVDMIWDGPRNHFGRRIWYPFDRGITNLTIAAAPRSTTQVVVYDHTDLNFSPNNLYIDKAAITAAGIHPTPLPTRTKRR